MFWEIELASWLEAWWNTPITKGHVVLFLLGIYIYYEILKPIARGLLRSRLFNRNKGN